MIVFEHGFLKQFPICFDMPVEIDIELSDFFLYIANEVIFKIYNKLNYKFIEKIDFNDEIKSIKNISKRLS